MTAAVHRNAAAIELTGVGRYTLLQSQAGRSQGFRGLQTPKKIRELRCPRPSIPSLTSLPRPATFRARPSSRKATRSTISGIDSLDFLDIAFAIDKAFGIKMPLEKWTQEVNEGKATTAQYFVLENLSARIDELVAAKSA